jgi:hypothetical protein
MSNNDPFRHMRQVNATNARVAQANRRVNDARRESYRGAVQANQDMLNRTRAAAARQNPLPKTKFQEGDARAASSRSILLFLLVLVVLFGGLALVFFIAFALLNSA